jgi:Cof subfamily protein (haloacid dehalogenase superfamily)
MMGKTIFFDIDGTLWDRDRKFPDSTPETIEKLRRNGHRVFICSGRGRANIQDPALLQLGFDGIIAACGNHIELDGRVLYEKLLPEPLVRRSMAVLRDNGMPFILEGPEFYWFDPEDFACDPYVEDLWDQLGPRARHLAEDGGGYRVNKFSADYSSEQNYNHVKQALQEELDFIDHGHRVIEFIPKGTSKATGIAKYLELSGTDPEDIYAVGDGANDIDMIACVKHSIAMGSGSETLKASAEYVTTGLWEDGIRHAMEHYGLI